MKNLLKVSVAATALMLAQAGHTAFSASETVAEAADAKAEIGAWGIDLEARDTAVKPGDDFARYANGAWLDSFEIPADLSGYGIFTKLRLEAEEDVRKIVEELAAENAKSGTLEQKVGDVYEAWMNVERLDELGLKPLRTHLDDIAKIKTRDDLMKAFSNIHYTAPVSASILPDPADTTRYSAILFQSGLGMPNRDYYLKQEDRFQEYRAAYKDYVTKVLTLAGIEGADEKANQIIAIETKLAEVHWTPEDSRNIQKVYNPMTRDQLKELAPEFDWDTMLTTVGLGDLPTIIAAQTTAIAASGKIVEETPVAQWKDYLAYHFIRSNAAYLPSAFDQASFEFFSRTLSGTEEQRARWKRGVNLINGSLGEAVGQIYLDRHFPPSNKEDMDALVGNLIEAFEERLKENAWMDEETRERALVKLSTFEPRIGYPTKWTDYGPLKIKKGKMLENALAIGAFQWQDQLDQLDGPVDRERWPLPPQTVNAFYNPLLNQITFPAGILQPPFFDPAADPAVNYGAIGAVIGHEIGHGFDDQGRRFDETGKINDWWTKTSDDAFNERAAKLGAQYAKYEPVEGLNINPELTMGENIGDLGGVQMAHAAYRRYLDECCDGEAPVIDGFTGDQRFFMAWAQVWRAKYREDALRQYVLTDPHSPAYYRINGVVRNVDAWYDAFGVTKDDELYLAPEDRVYIW